MIRARRRRIVAVIGGDDQQIVGAQLRQQLGQPRVEALEIARRSRRRRCDARRRVSKSTRFAKIRPRSRPIRSRASIASIAFVVVRGVDRAR